MASRVRRIACVAAFALSQSGCWVDAQSDDVPVVRERLLDGAPRHDGGTRVASFANFSYQDIAASASELFLVTYGGGAIDVFDVCSPSRRARRIPGRFDSADYVDSSSSLVATSNSLRQISIFGRSEAPSKLIAYPPDLEATARIAAEADSSGVLTLWLAHTLPPGKLTTYRRVTYDPTTDTVSWEKASRCETYGFSGLTARDGRLVSFDAYTPARFAELAPSVSCDPTFEMLVAPDEHALSPIDFDYVRATNDYFVLEPSLNADGKVLAYSVVRLPGSGISSAGRAEE